MAVASFNYNDMADSTGLLDNANVRITQSNFEMFDYGGKANPTPALHWAIETLEDGETVAQYWPVGKATDWVPSEDGKTLESIGSAIKVSKTTNCGMLVKSLMDAGYPMENLGAGDFSVIEGMECHVDRISSYRRGLENTKDKTVLIVTKILAMPGEENGKARKKSRGAAKPGKVKPESAPEANTPNESKEDAETTAMECVMNILAEKGGELTKAALMMAVQVALKGSPLKAAVNTLLFKGDLLDRGPWTFKEGKISI